jgi:hypothetical protein
MRYAVSILRRVQKELALLPLKDYEQVRETIRSLSQTPRPGPQVAKSLLPGKDGACGWEDTALFMKSMISAKLFWSSTSGTDEMFIGNSGRADMAQAGGPDKEKVPQAIQQAYELVARKAKQQTEV